jgi:hypothetical protein
MAKLVDRASLGISPPQEGTLDIALRATQDCFSTPSLHKNTDVYPMLGVGTWPGFMRRRGPNHGIRCPVQTQSGERHQAYTDARTIPDSGRIEEMSDDLKDVKRLSVSTYEYR